MNESANLLRSIPEHDSDSERAAGPAEWMAAFEPRLGLDDWEPIAGTVRAAIGQVDEVSERRVLSLMSVATAFVHWCHHNGERPDFDLFEIERIEAFIADSNFHGWSPSGSSTRRSELLAVADAINGQTASGRLRSLDHRVKSQPYSAAEVSLLCQWVRRQRPATRRINAGVLIALGLGAGLASGEICDVVAGDIVDGPCGLSVVTGGRVVPVVARFEPFLRDALTVRSGEQRLFGGREVSGGKNYVANFISRRPKGHPVDPNRWPEVSTHRMRATWLVGRLNSGVPIKELTAMAGLETLRTLNELLVWVEPASAVEVDRLMRSGSRSRKAAA